MERFYKMWLQQLHHHLDLISKPSQSVATLSPQTHSQTDVKARKGTKHVAWNTEALLPWITIAIMMAWLLLQSYRQAHSPQGITGSPFIVWSSNSSALPDVVPVAHHL